MTPEGIEPSTFGFGIRRATNYAMESLYREQLRGGEKALNPGPERRITAPKGEKIH